jgi:hypothetical protein
MSNDGVIVLNSRKKLTGVLTFTVDALTENKTLLGEMNGKEVTREFVGSDEKQINILVSLEPGKNRIVFNCLEGTLPASRFGPANDSRQLSFKFFNPSFDVY